MQTSSRPGETGDEDCDDDGIRDSVDPDSDDGISDDRDDNDGHDDVVAGSDGGSRSGSDDPMTI